MKPNDKFIYRSGNGGLYEARVLNVHRDGTYTIRLGWPLDDRGNPILSCYQGDKVRICDENAVRAVR